MAWAFVLSCINMSIPRRGFLKQVLSGVVGAVVASKKLPAQSAAQVLEPSAPPQLPQATQKGRFYSDELNEVMDHALSKTNRKLSESASKDQRLPVNQIIDILNVRILNNPDIVKDLSKLDRTYSAEPAYQKFKRDFNTNTLPAQKASAAFEAMQTTYSPDEFKTAAKTFFDQLITIEKNSGLDLRDSIINKLGAKLYDRSVTDTRQKSTFKSLDIDHAFYKEWTSVLTDPSTYADDEVNF